MLCCTDRRQRNGRQQYLRQNQPLAVDQIAQRDDEQQPQRVTHLSRRHHDPIMDEATPRLWAIESSNGCAK